MESIETWHAEHVALATWHATADEILAAGETALDVRSLPAAIDGTVHRSQVRSWLPGRDLRRGEAVWVPEEIVSLNFVADAMPEPSLARNSNGLASGNDLTEAIRHGLCEVIERDAETRWRLSADSRRLDLETVVHPECLRLLDQVQRAGIYTACWDITADNGIPCYGCILLAPPDADTWLGIGAHDGFCCRTTPGAAMAGAMMEALQKRLTYISGSRDDIGRDELDRVRSPDLVEAVWNEVTHEAPSVRFPLDTGEAPDSAAEDVSRLLAAVLPDGGRRQAVVVDLTRPELGVPVAKTIVTGLEGPYGLCQTMSV